MSYYIKYPSKNNNVTELWSAARLPFEPKGWFLDMRKDLKDAIRQMSLNDGKILYASYNSPDQGFCDIDNVLFYNVGSGVFKNICQNGFLIERGYKNIVVPAERQEEYSHYQQYSLVEKTQKSQYWQKKRVLAAWKEIVLEKMPEKPHQYWQIMKKHRVLVDAVPYNGQYGLEIIMYLPYKFRQNFAGLIRPMLDGIIASLHSYSGDYLNEVSQRLATVLDDKPEEISTLLLDQNRAVLGSRCLVHPFSDFVQWNPADDQCVFIKLINNFVSENQITMNGMVFSVK
jgi:hypothetical protein